MNTTISVKSSEGIKQRNALELEARKWEYKQEELRYLEAGQHLRSLNQLMWQAPGTVVAITGGLWYGATTIDSDIARSIVLGFAALFDALTIIIIWRLRDLIQRHIDLQIRFAHFGNPPSDGGRRTVIICWTVALLTAAIVGAVGALFPSTLAKKASEPPFQVAPVCCQTPLEITVKSPPIQQCKPRRAQRASEPKPVRCNP
jgi:hypothetical protein